VKKDKIRKKLGPKFLVVKFVSTEKLSRADWAREMKIAKNLLEKRGEDLFIQIVLGFKLNSLAWFLTNDGKIFVEKYKSELKLNLQHSPSVQLLPTSVGESLAINKKPLTIKDFLKKYGQTS
jgi:hypothetical protein